MSDLNQVGATDGWRCWLCDQPVDQDASVNSDLGPSVDSYFVTKAKKGTPAPERLAHRSCNTMKGKYEPQVAWPSHLIVGDPAPIFATVDRLARKGGREAVGRFQTQVDANEASEWLLDRLSRLAPTMSFTTVITPGGGQFLLALKTL
jgi:hypothetical protein